MCLVPGLLPQLGLNPRLSLLQLPHAALLESHRVRRRRAHRHNAERVDRSIRAAPGVVVEVRQRRGRPLRLCARNERRPGDGAGVVSVAVVAVALGDRREGRAVDQQAVDVEVGSNVPQSSVALVGRRLERQPEVVGRVVRV